MLRKRVLSLLFIGWFTPLSYAVDAENLTVFTEQFSPYNYIQDDQLTGINFTLVKRACKSAGIQCEFKLFPWTRALDLALKTPQSGLVSVSRTPEREALFQWVGPLVSGQACLYKLKKRRDIPVLNKATLRNHTIGLMRNDIYQTILSDWGLKENEDFLVYSDRYEDAQAFALGKLDLILASYYTLNAYLKHGGLSVREVEPVFHIQDSRLGGNFLALNLSVSGKLRDKLQKGIDAITSEQKRKVIARHLEVEPERKKYPGSLKPCF